TPTPTTPTPSPSTPTPGTPTPGAPTPGAPGPAEPSPTPPSPPGTAYQVPPYQAPPVGGQAAPPYPGGQPPTHTLAVVALVCAVAGVITAVSAPVGAVLGHLALRQIAQTGEEGAGLAKAAIWVGWIITGLIVVACCAVFALAIALGRSGDFGPP